MTERFDKLGRRIPQFDRSAAGAKGAKTQKEKYGNDFHTKHGAIGGRKRARGYFGTLKDAGNEAAIREAAKKGAEKTNSRSVEEKHASAIKGWETKRQLKSNHRTHGPSKRRATTLGPRKGQK